MLVHTHRLDTLGGAELSLRSHVASAPSDVEVDVIRPDDPVDLRHYGTVVLSNLRPEGGLGEAAEYRPALDWAQRLMGYRGYAIRLEQDTHPCPYRDTRCIDFSSDVWKKCDCESPIRERFRQLYNLCDTVIFHSPLHRKAINHMIQIQGPRQVIVGCPVDFDRFRSITPLEERKHVALITGDALRVAPEAEALANAAGYSVDRVEYLSVPYEKMPELLNRYQAVVVAPAMLHASGRLAFEAMACGCRLITNDRVGAMTLPDPLATSREADATFWAVVASRPKRPNPNRFPRKWGWRRRRKCV